MIRRVAELKAYEAEDFGGVRVKLDAMENPYTLPEPIRREVADAVMGVLVNRYPDPEAAALKAALAEQLGVGPKSLVLGNGSDELIGMVISAFGGSPGLIAYPSPTFSMYGIIAKETLELPTGPDFDIDIDGAMRLVRERAPKVIFIAYPNNPTGNLYSREKVRRLIEESGAVVVVDEAYNSFSGESFIGYIGKHENLAVLRTLSKVGMAGLRVGMLAAGPEIVSAINKVRLPYNINSLSQAAAGVILRHKSVVDAQVRLIIEERERMYGALSAMPGVTAWDSKTNFILFRVPDAGRAFAALKGRGILVRNLDAPGPLAGCLRVTVGTEEEDTEFLATLQEAL